MHLLMAAPGYGPGGLPLSLHPGTPIPLESCRVRPRQSRPSLAQRTPPLRRDRVPFLSPLLPASQERCRTSKCTCEQNGAGVEPCPGFDAESGRDGEKDIKRDGERGRERERGGAKRRRKEGKQTLRDREGDRDTRYPFPWGDFMRNLGYFSGLFCSPRLGDVCGNASIPHPPVATSQTRMVWSPEALAASLPSLLTSTFRIVPS